MNTKTGFKKDLLFPIIVAILSVVNLVQQFSYFGIISTITSFVGIVGVIFFFLRNNKYKLLFYVWIVVQLLHINITYDDYDIGARVTKIIWDAVQSDISFHLSLTINGFSIQLNLVAIIYLILFRALKISELKGATLTFSKLKADSHFGDDLPVEGIVIDILKVGGEKEWLLVQLDSSVSNGETKINTVLVKRKDEEVIKPKQDGQIVYFRLVDDINAIYTAERVSQFPLIEWVLCK